ncbi:type IV secretory pathway VirB10-like protein [Bradyrhizobium sp. LM3.4]
MNDTDQAIDTPKEAPRDKSPEEIAETLRLRPDPPKVARLSRKVLIGGSALVLLLITGAVLWALQEKRSGNSAPEELYATDHHNVADQLATLPKDYTEIPKDVPRLGPPLPGDLGRPIVAAQGSSTSGSLGIDAEQQRVNQESEAARTSKVFASTNVRPQAPATSSSEARSSAAPSSDEAFAQNGQDRKLAFVSATVDRRTTSSDRLVRPAFAFCRSGRNGHSGRADHRNPLRPAWPDHGASHRSGVRFSYRASSPYSPGSKADRELR